MNMLSRRFVITIAAILGVSGATMAWFTIHPHQQDPCQNPGALEITSLIPGARHLRIRTDLPEAAILWAEGEFTNPLADQHPYRYQIVRGFNTLRISTHPVSYVANDVDGEVQRTIQVEVDGQSLSIHVVEDFTRSPPRLIAYLQIYGTTPTASPIGSHLRNLRAVLSHGTQPVTTVIVDGLVTRKGLPEAEKAISEWIGGAWTFIDRFCSVPVKRAR